MHTLLHTILNRIATGRLPLLNAAEAVTLALLPEQDNLDILAAASAAPGGVRPGCGRELRHRQRQIRALPGKLRLLRSIRASSRQCARVPAHERG